MADLKNSNFGFKSSGGPNVQGQITPSAKTFVFGQTLGDNDDLRSRQQQTPSPAAPSQAAPTPSTFTFGQTLTPSERDEPKGFGFFENIVPELEEGTVRVGQHLARGAEAAGVFTGLETLEDVGRETADKIESHIEHTPRYQREIDTVLQDKEWHEALRDPREFRGYVAKAFGENAPSFVAALGSTLSGMAVGGAVAGPPGAVVGGLLGGMGMAHFLESGASYDELLDVTGGDKEAAAETAQIVGGVNAALEMVPIGRLAKHVPGFKKAFGEKVVEEVVQDALVRRTVLNTAKEVGSEGIKQAGTEALTEGLQSIVSNAGKKFYDEHQSLFEGVPESMFIGALIGGPAGGVSQLYTSTRKDDKANLTQDSKPFDAEDIIGRVEENIQKNPDVLLALPSPRDVPLYVTPEGEAKPTLNTERFAGAADENAELGLTPDVIAAQEKRQLREGGQVSLSDNSVAEIPAETTPIIETKFNESQLRGRISELNNLAEQATDPFIVQSLRQQAREAELELEGEKPTLTKKERQRRALFVDPTKDDLYTAIRKLGGLDTELESDWQGRFSHLERDSDFGVPAFERAGSKTANSKTKPNTLDDLVERLTELNYLSPGSDKSALEAKLDAISQGEQVYSIQYEPEANASEKEPEITNEELEEIQAQNYYEAEYENLGSRKDNGGYNQRLSDEGRKLSDLIDEVQAIDENVVESLLSKEISDSELAIALFDYLGEFKNDQAQQEKETQLTEEAPVGRQSAEDTVGGLSKPQVAKEQEPVTQIAPLDTSSLAEDVALQTGRQPETIEQQAEDVEVSDDTPKKPVEIESPPTETAKASRQVKPPKEQKSFTSKRVAKVLENHGLSEEIMTNDNFHVHVKNDGYLDLSIEAYPSVTGNPKQRTVRFTHFVKEVDGDLSIDSEMTFEVASDPESINDGAMVLSETTVRGPFGGRAAGLDQSFANLFSKNLIDQGFADPSVAQLIRGDKDATDTSVNLESDSGRGGGEVSGIQATDEEVTGKNGSDNGRNGEEVDGERLQGEVDNRVADNGPNASGKRGDNQLHPEEPTERSTKGNGDTGDRGRSSPDSREGIQPKLFTDEGVEQNADPGRGRGQARRGDTSTEGRDDEGLSAKPESKKKKSKQAEVPKNLKERIAAQKKANDSQENTIPGDEGNVRNALPLLYERQQDDVIKAENRLLINNQSGFMLTNGTGTGKTYSGLGVVRRFVNMGKSRILILAPTDLKVKDWIEDANNLGLNISQLSGIKDAGEGIVATTYANFQANKTLMSGDFDLIVTDESHYIQSNQKGAPTSVEKALRTITRVEPFYASQWLSFHDPEYLALYEKGEKKYLMSKYGHSNIGKLDDFSVNDVISYMWSEASGLAGELNNIKDRLNEEALIESDKKKVKTLFLSATPFAYIKNLMYANNYLFDINEGKSDDLNEFRGYNEGNNEQQFFMDNFGMRMRTGKLTKAEAGVDSSLLERKFFHKLEASGAISTSQLNLEQDYQRAFIEVPYPIGKDIDKAFELMREEGIYPKYLESVSKRFNFLVQNQLMEGVKAEQMLDRVKEHLKSGRKVVVFHNYNKGTDINPFFSVNDSDARKQMNVFFTNHPELKGRLALLQAQSPLVVFGDAFADTELGIINGTQPKKKRRDRVKDFNDDNGTTKVLLVQADAGKEGISLHDTSGKHQRVLISLGLPYKPTSAIQIEGRIYRDGVQSNAIFEYPIISSNFERWAYGTTISERVKTPENLAMGDAARRLDESFRNGYNWPLYGGADALTGEGGKEFDAAITNSLTPFDEAKTYYWAQKKRTSKDKSKEGVDYFATPEPLGVKMVEWAAVKPGEKMLEPSAGHGAIARWFPEFTSNTYIEPSGELSSKLAVSAKAGNVRQEKFEDLSLVNKYDAIVMNPPFGKAGSTAIAHVKKAFSHLADGGRLVVLYPDGSAKDKLHKWLFDEKTNGYLRREINLPSVTFERAGTSVRASIYIIDKGNPATLDGQSQLDFTNAENINEFFDRIEQVGEKPRLNPNVTLKDFDLVVTKGEDGMFYVSGNTFEHRNILKYLNLPESKKKPRWDQSRKAWKYDANPSKKLLDDLKVEHGVENQINPNDVLYSISSKVKGMPKGVDREVIEEEIAKFQRRFKGSRKFDIRVFATEEEAFGIKEARENRGVKGGYYPHDETFIIIGSNLSTPLDAAETLRHEILGHYGLDLFEAKVKKGILESILEARNGLFMRRYFADVEARYPNEPPLMQAEEVFARIAESQPSIAIKAWDAVLNKISQALRAIGLLDNVPTVSELRKLVKTIGEGVDRGAKRRNFPSSNEPQFSKFGTPDFLEQKTLLDKLKEGQPIDKAFQAPFKMVGADKLTKGIYNALSHAVNDWKPSGSMEWLTPYVTTARAGLIDMYGLSDEYRQTKQGREAKEREIAIKGAEIFKSLAQSGISGAEARVLQRILTNEHEEIPSEEWNEIAEPIRKAIDQLGLEAVEYGLLDRETYEKHRGAYLHRVYKKHEFNDDKLSSLISNTLTRRRKGFYGKELKRRGMSFYVEQDTVVQNKDWWGLKHLSKLADASLIGRKVIVLDRHAASGEGTVSLKGIKGDKKKGRILERVYWPADKPVPAKYSEYENKGEWEITGSKGTKVELWRDYTKEEREQMGEILDARYTIVKTFQIMAHDLSTGKFFQDISENPAWTWHDDGLPDAPIDRIGDAATFHRTGLGRFNTYTNYDWVLVPTSNLTGTNKKRWGALAGKYVRAEVWRDINELDLMNTQGFWKKALTQWKLNKTARSPVVHMNNIVSNIMFMDLADVRMVDLKRGIMAMKAKDEHYQQALHYGAFGAGFIQQEINKDILEPLAKEILEENLSGKSELEARFGFVGKITNAAWDKLWELDDAMVKAYQFEDEVFRMATYMRHIGMGKSPQEAALIARDQFLNYDISAPWVNALRGSVLPFISYTYRAVPVLAQSLAERPWKIAKYVAMYEGLNALAYSLAPGDEERERESLRPDQQGRTWLGTPRMIRMPMRDEYGSPVFLDIRRWMPAGDIFDMNQGQSALPIPAPLQFGGPLMLAGELMLNKTAFTGREIFKEEVDTGAKRAEKVALWGWRSWMPSAPWIYRGWYYDKLMNAAKGAKGADGRPYQLDQALLSSIGIKLSSQNVAYGIERRRFELDMSLRQLKSERTLMRKYKNRGIISRDELKKDEGRIQERIEELTKKKRELY